VFHPHSTRFFSLPLSLYLTLYDKYIVAHKGCNHAENQKTRHIYVGIAALRRSETHMRRGFYSRVSGGGGMNVIRNWCAYTNTQARQKMDPDLEDVTVEKWLNESCNPSDPSWLARTNSNPRRHRRTDPIPATLQKPRQNLADKQETDGTTSVETGRTRPVLRRRRPKKPRKHRSHEHFQTSLDLRTQVAELRGELKGLRRENRKWEQIVELASELDVDLIAS